MINTSNLLSNAASFGMCADAAMATGFDMYNKYYILGQSVDSDTKWEVLSLGMSVLGSVVSAKGMSKSTKELSDLLQKEGFTNALKEEVFGLASGFKRTPDIMPGGSGMGMNLQFFGGGKSGIDSSNPFYKQGGGSDLDDFMSIHAQKHVYNPEVKSTKNKTQFGENIDVAKLREDTLLHPDQVIYDSEHNMIKYVKEYDFNISTPDTPTGSHRVFINLAPRAGKTIRNSQFPYYGGNK